MHPIYVLALSNCERSSKGVVKYHPITFGNYNSSIQYDVDDAFRKLTKILVVFVKYVNG